MSGEFVASHSHLLLSVFDDRFESQSAAGSNDIFEARQNGTASSLLPDPEESALAADLPYSKQGPVIHLFHPRKKTLSLSPIPSTGNRGTHPLRFLPPYELGPENKPLRDRIANIWNLQEMAETLSHGERDVMLDAYAEWQSKGIDNLLKVLPPV